MNFTCKSSPIISQKQFHKKCSNSKRPSHQRNSNQYQHHKVINPFRDIKQNILPSGLVQQISPLQYLTPHKVQQIPWRKVVHVPRRSSIFAKHLLAMQRAANQQTLKINLKNQLNNQIQPLAFASQNHIRQIINTRSDCVSSCIQQATVSKQCSSKVSIQMWQQLQQESKKMDCQLMQIEQPGTNKQFYSQDQIESPFQWQVDQFFQF